MVYGQRALCGPSSGPCAPLGGRKEKESRRNTERKNRETGQDDEKIEEYGKKGAMCDVAHIPALAHLWGVEKKEEESQQKAVSDEEGQERRGGSEEKLDRQMKT